MVRHRVVIAVLDKNGNVIIRKKAKMEMNKEGIRFYIRYKPKKEYEVTEMRLYLKGELWRVRKFRNPVELIPNKEYMFQFDLAFPEPVSSDE